MQHRARQRILGMVFAIVFSGMLGCVTTRDKGEFWSYGKFCGPGEPKVMGATMAERVAELKSILPEDDIDELCKEHDICYEERGAHNSECDKDLRRYLLAIRFHPAVEQSCLKVRDHVLFAFSCFQPTGHQPSHWLIAPITIPVGLAICATSTPLGALGSLSPAVKEAGKCKAANSFREVRRRMDDCIQRAGTDAGELGKCMREFSRLRQIPRDAEEERSSSVVELPRGRRSCPGTNSWKIINGVNCLVDSCGNILDNKKAACLVQTH